MAAHTPKVATLFGALDSAAIAADRPLSAHQLQVLAMDVNRLVKRGEPVLQMIWDAELGSVNDDTDSISYHAGFNAFGWTRLVWGPLTVPKKPNLDRMTVSIGYKIPLGTNAYVQVCSLKSPFDPNPNLADTKKVLPLAGADDWVFARASDIPCARGESESLDFYIKGEKGGAEIDTAAYGTLSHGTVDTYGGPGHHPVLRSQFHDGSANWNTGGTTIADGSVAVFLYGPGNELLTTPRLVTRVIDSETFEFYPSFSAHELDAIDGSTYYLRHLQRWRLCNLAVYTDDQP